MEVIVKHLMGTVILMALVASTGLSYTIIASSIEADVLKQQLEDVGEHVSSKIVEVAALVNFADYLNNVTMVETLNIPPDVGGRAYAVELRQPTQVGEGYSVNVYLCLNREISASAIIPLNSTANRVTVLAGSEGLLTARGGVVVYSGVVYSGGVVVVWGWRRSIEETWVGIGVFREEAG